MLRFLVSLQYKVSTGSPGKVAARMLWLKGIKGIMVYKETKQH